MKKQLYKQEFCNLLRSTNRKGIDQVLDELERIGFFHAPAASKKHMAYDGGLMEHSLAVWHVAERLMADMKVLRPDIVINEDSMKLVTLLHDVCKSEHYRWIEDKNAYEADFTSLPIGHGEKSVIMLLRMGLELHDDEMLAIRWHMGAWDLTLHSKEQQTNFSTSCSQTPLVPLLQTADTLAAMIIEKGK